MIRPPRLTLNCFAELLHRYVDLVQPEWIDLRRNMHRVQHTKRPPRSTRSTLPSSVGKQTKTSFQTETYQIGPHHNQQHRQKARRRHDYRCHPSDRRAPNERCQSEEDEEAHCRYCVLTRREAARPRCAAYTPSGDGFKGVKRIALVGRAPLSAKV